MTDAEVTILIKIKEVAAGILDKTKKGINSLGDTASKTGSKLGGLTSKVGGLVGGLGSLAGPLGLVAGAGIAAAGVMGVKMVDAASNLQESIAKSNVVFGANAKEVEKWAGGMAKSFGQSKQQALEAAGTYGNLFQAFGLGQEESTKMSKSLVELAGDMASFNNTSVDDALLALRSGLSGETEPLKRFGVALNEVRLKEEALKLGLISSTKDALTPAIKAQAAYALVMNDTKLAQGDAARSADNLAMKKKVLSAQIGNLQASFGSALLPVMSLFIGMLSDHVIPLVEAGSKHFATFAEMIGAFASGDGPRAVELFAALPAPLQQVALWLAENKDEIIGFAMTVKGLAQDVIAGWIRVLQELGPHLVKLGQFLSEHKPLLIAVAVALGVLLIAIVGIPAAIAVLIVAIGLLAAHWDTIKAKTLEFWDSLGEPVQRALQHLWTTITFYFEVYKVLFIGFFNIIRDIVNIAMALLRGDWGLAWENIRLLINHAWDMITQLIGLQLGFIRDTFLFWIEMIKGILQAGWDAIVSAAGDAWGAFKDAITAPIDAVIDKIQDLIDKINSIPSPSELVDKIPGSGIVKKGAGLLGFAGGGFARGLVEVGEHGRELINLGAQGGYVHTNAQSDRMLGGRGMAFNGPVTFVLPNVREPADFGRELMREQDRMYRGVS